MQHSYLEYAHQMQWKAMLMSGTDIRDDADAWGSMDPWHIIQQQAVCFPYILVNLQSTVAAL